MFLYRKTIKWSVLMSVLFMVSVNAADIPNIHLGKEIVSPEKVIKLFKPHKSQGRSLMLGDKQTEDKTMVSTYYSPRSISLEVSFDFDSSRLNKRSLRQLSPIAEAVGDSQLNGLSFELVGHTDASGLKHYNQLLSVKRAKTVKHFFVEKFAIEPNKLHIIGKGETDLLDPQRPYSSVNRRVTIIAIQN